MAQLRKALEPIRDLVWRRANRITSMIPPPPYGGSPARERGRAPGACMPLPRAQTTRAPH